MDPITILTAGVLVSILCALQFKKDRRVPRVPASQRRQDLIDCALKCGYLAGQRFGHNAVFFHRSGEKSLQK